MKPYVMISLMLAAGCSIDRTSDTTLTPMITSTVPVTTSGNTLPRDQFAFIDDVYYIYGATPSMDNDTLIEFGIVWCEALEMGMTPEDVESRINEGAIDNDDAELHRAIVKSAVTNLCPEQADKWSTSNG